MKLYENKLLIAGIMFLIISLYFALDSNIDSGITGDAITRTSVELIPSPAINCSTSLTVGWNFVSFPCFGSYVERTTALASINQSYTIIFKYHASDTTDPWKSYNSNLPNWTVQQVTHMDRFSGYWIYITNNSEFSYAGLTSSSSIPLYSGWNLVGYPKYASANVSSVLNGISFTQVQTYDKNSDTWLIYVNGGSGNTLSNFTAYDAYWVNVSSSQTWNVN